MTPRGSRNAIALEGDVVRVWLRTPPVEGAANKALIELLAARLDVPRRAITLLRGETSRVKLLAIEGLSAEEFHQRLGG